MDKCKHCGSVDTWFCRTIEPGCGSMHNVCSRCGRIYPCGDSNCVGLSYDTPPDVEPVVVVAAEKWRQLAEMADQWNSGDWCTPVAHELICRFVEIVKSVEVPHD